MLYTNQIDPATQPAGGVKRARLHMLFSGEESILCPLDNKPIITLGGLIRLLILATALMLFATEAFPEETVSVPWPEFRQLFEESITKKIKAQTPEPEKPQIHSLDNAVYHLAFKQNRVQGKVKLSGRIISGGPEAIALFSSSLIIDEIISVTNGYLLCVEKPSPAVVFYPEGVGAFQIEVAFLAPVIEDHRYGTVSFAIPPVLNNAVYIDALQAAHLVAEPGLKAPDGGYRFSARDILTLKMAKSDARQSPATPKADLFTSVRWESGTSRMETFFWPRQSLPATYDISIPPDFTVVSASLPADAIKILSDNKLQATVTAETPMPFSIIQARTEATEETVGELRIPFIPGNSGNQGNFIIEQPQHRHMSVVQPANLVRLPLAGLPDDVQQVFGTTGFFSRIDTSVALGFRLRGFKEISVPPIVLNTIAFFTAIEENGNQLSTLVMDIPPEIGNRLAIQPIANAQIWRLLVNGTPRNVFSHEDGTWLIPLDQGRVSHVELAILTPGDKLGIQGRLATMIPGIGLPSQNLVAGIALPDRVELISMEGAVTPTAKSPTDIPESFAMGHAYFFSRAFYKGESLPLAIAYKEPVQSPKE